MTALIQPLVSVTHTKRRRFLWCAWWTGAPAVDVSPFLPPDAWSGGARTVDEAVKAASLAAGLELVVASGRWAGAWVRVRAGLPPFPERAPRTAAQGPRPTDPHVTLGVSIGAPLEELKARFRASALALHPDHGGDAAAFIAMKRAYDTLASRRSRPR